MQYPDPQFWVLALAALIYLVLFAIILRTRSMGETRMALLQVFLLAVTTWSVTQAMLRAIQLDQLAGYDSGVLERMGMYLVVVIAALFYALTCRFEQRGRRELYGWISAGLFLTTGVILSENFLNLPDYLMRAFGLVMVRSLAADAVLVCGWGYFMASALIITIGAYHRAATPYTKTVINTGLWQSLCWP